MNLVPIFMFLNFFQIFFKIRCSTSKNLKRKDLSGYFQLSDVPYDMKLLPTTQRKKIELEDQKERLKLLLNVMQVLKDPEYLDHNNMNDYTDVDNAAFKRTPKMYFNTNLQEKVCQLQTVVLGTYTNERGTQAPSHVHVKLCQGGLKNPENYQCQPTDTAIECFKTLNSKQTIDYLGISVDTGCEERCICAREECTNKKIERLLCPQGYLENSKTCLCEARQGVNAKLSLLFRNRALYTTIWKTDLTEMCRKHADANSMKRSLKIGESFLLKKIHGVYQRVDEF